MKKILILSFITGAITQLSCNHKEDKLTAKDIQAVISRFDKGWFKKDTLAVDSALAANYIYFTQSGGTYDRQNVLKTAASEEYVLDHYSREEISYRIEGNTAIVNTVWIGTGTYRGKPFADTQRCSITVIKSEGKAQILSEHCTVIR
jgi:hypothetical protein